MTTTTTVRIPADFAAGRSTESVYEATSIEYFEIEGHRFAEVFFQDANGIECSHTCAAERIIIEPASRFYADFDAQIITCQEHRRDGMSEISADEAWELAALDESTEPTPDLVCQLHRPAPGPYTLEQIIENVAEYFSLDSEAARPIVMGAIGEVYLPIDQPTYNYAEAYAIQAVAGNN